MLIATHVRGIITQAIAVFAMLDLARRMLADLVG
jgi:hypothetical protein